VSDVLVGAGWSKEKAAIFRESFIQFCGQITINSKELGQCKLADSLYRAQFIALDAIFSGLQDKIHYFDILKSRQLGISTVVRALSLFWCGIHPGMKGYAILDSEAHLNEARVEITGMARNLPTKFSFPRMVRENRNMMELANGSTLNFASGGVRQGRSSGTLGRSSGVNFCHVSEMCSIDNPEGIAAFLNSLAEDFPNRLYIWESTARGYNQRHDMWVEALNDPAHKKTVFIGWWAKDNQKIERSYADFERYGLVPPSEKEMLRIREVKEKYDWDITPEQLAWIRRKMNPSAQAEGDNDPEFEGDVLGIQEQPWTDSDAYQMTGATFFAPENLKEQIAKHVSGDYKTYCYYPGIEFTDFSVQPAANARSVQLKVWQEPVEDSVYIVAADPAFGHSEKSDRSCAQVLRCYSDGIEQVAEYAWPLIDSRQFGWVLASLLGWYGGDKSEVYLILEINGPGDATWRELLSLKRQLQHNYLIKAKEQGLQNIFQNARNYLYQRSDSMTPGSSWHWKTSGPLKVAIMERLRDFTHNGMLWIRSLDTLEEMRSVTREGDSIEAQGVNKDDRVMAMAMGIRYWDEKIRTKLMATKRTRSFEEAKRRMTITDQYAMFNGSQLETFLAGKARVRSHNRLEAVRASWRSRR